MSEKQSYRVLKQIQYCLNMEPIDEDVNQISELRRKLSKITTKSTTSKQKLRSSASSDKKKNDTTLQDLVADMERMTTNIEILIECFSTLLGKIETIADLGRRIDIIEQKNCRIFTSRTTADAHSNVHVRRCSE